MKHSIWLAGALALSLGLRGPVRAADEPRRPDTGTYSSDQPLLRNGGPATPLPVVPAGAPVLGPIASLRATHIVEYQSLVQAVVNARNEAERRSLDLRAVAMKRDHQRSELQALRADALLRHDTACATRLDEALLNLEPRPAPLATTLVPRDARTGHALDPAVEGSAR